MKKKLNIALLASITIAVFSCNKHENNTTVPDKKQKEIEVSYETELTDNSDTDETDDGSELREEAKGTKVQFQLKATSGTFAKAYKIKYWAYPLNIEPDLNTFKSTANTNIYNNPKGIITKKGHKAVGSKRLVTNKWIVFEEQNTKTLYKFKNNCSVDRCRHFVGMAEVGAKQFSAGYFDSVGTVKVSNQWGLEKKYDTFTISWYSLTINPNTTFASVLSQSDPIGAADGSITFNNADGSGIYKSHSFRLPYSEYYFFFKEHDGNNRVVYVNLKPGKSPYLKFHESSPHE